MYIVYFFIVFFTIFGIAYCFPTKAGKEKAKREFEQRVEEEVQKRLKQIEEQENNVNTRN